MKTGNIYILDTVRTRVTRFLVPEKKCVSQKPFIMGFFKNAKNPRKIRMKSFNFSRYAYFY